MERLASRDVVQRVVPGFRVPHAAPVRACMSVSVKLPVTTSRCVLCKWEAGCFKQPVQQNARVTALAGLLHEREAARLSSESIRQEVGVLYRVPVVIGGWLFGGSPLR